MSPSGRSEMPTESPSSIQNPIPSSRVRRMAESSTSAASPAGTASQARDGARARSAEAGRGAMVAMRFRFPPLAGAPGKPVPGLRELGIARVDRQWRRAHRQGGTRPEREDLRLVEVQVQQPGDHRDLEGAGEDVPARLDP